MFKYIRELNTKGYNISKFNKQLPKIKYYSRF